VLYLGYADPPAQGNAFAGCLAPLRTLARRVAMLSGVTHVPVAHAIDPADRSFYDLDGIHPSAKASAVMAGLLADAIRAAPVWHAWAQRRPRRRKQR